MDVALHEVVAHINALDSLTIREISVVSDYVFEDCALPVRKSSIMASEFAVVSAPYIVSFWDQDLYTANELRQVEVSSCIFASNAALAGKFVETIWSLDAEGVAYWLWLLCIDLVQQRCEDTPGLYELFASTKRLWSPEAAFRSMRS